MSADESDAHVLSDGFGDNAKQQLRELIRPNYNHPSVIVWGLSNELHQPELKSLRQYGKLISGTVEVLLNSGIKMLAKLDAADDEGITAVYKRQVSGLYSRSAYSKACMAAKRLPGVR